MNFRIILILLLLLAVDFYVYFGLRFLFTPRSNAERIFTWVYWTITVVSLCIILSGMWLDWRSWPKAIRAYSLSIVIFSYLAKVLLSFFLILDDVVRLFRFSGNYVSGWFTEKPSVEQAGISRLRFLVQFGALFSAIPVVSLLYGMTGNAYRYKIRRVRLSLPDLPEAFEGFKALQISDLHVGSFLSQDPLRRAVGLINEESPDVVFFTGDLVNDRHQE
ncbi:MAG: metallophosphoesterase, partial [Bacteroidota bacterium]